MASRQLTEVFEAALGDAVFRPFYTVELRFDEGTVRFWTGIGTLVLSGVSYAGAGNLLEISSVDETVDLSARGVELTLSGISSTLITRALTSTYQGRKCLIGFGALSGASLLKEDGDFILLEDGGKINLELLLGGVNEVFAGYMDKMDITEDGESSSISMKVENKLITLERARIARYNSGYQKSIFPNDLGLDHVEALQEKEITWGS
jgi:hypothetical protein